MLALAFFSSTSKAEATNCCNSPWIFDSQKYQCCSLQANVCVPITTCGASEICYSNVCVDPNSITPTPGTGLCSNVNDSCCLDVRGQSVTYYCNNSLTCDGNHKCQLPGPIPTSVIFDPTCDLLLPLTGKGIDTALGCLPTDPQTFVGLVIPWAVGIGGGIAFLLMLYGVFMIIVSAGVPDKMQAGKELISSAITGLLIIIFAVFILRFIGVDVLGLFS